MLRLRLPSLTPAEKTALIALILIFGSGSVLRLWERSGLHLGPVHDWESMRRWVIAARQADTAPFGCPDPGSWAAHWPQRPESPTSGTPAAESRHGKKIAATPVDPNQADVQALQCLPGVGPATAQAIIADRARTGPFRAITDLMRIKGIGPKKFAAMRAALRIVPNAVGGGKKVSGT